jgi:hypothetical protein
VTISDLNGFRIDLKKLDKKPHVVEGLVTWVVQFDGFLAGGHKTLDVVEEQDILDIACIMMLG